MTQGRGSQAAQAGGEAQFILFYRQGETKAVCITVPKTLSNAESLNPRFSVSRKLRLRPAENSCFWNEN